MEQLTTNWVSRKVTSPGTGCRTIGPAQDQVKMTIFECDKYGHQVHAEESKKKKTRRNARFSVPIANVPALRNA